MVWKILLEIFIVLCAIPTGILISNMTKDERIQGRKWFLALTIISLLIGIIFFATEDADYYFGLFFITITSGISYLKSFKNNKA